MKQVLVLQFRIFVQYLRKNLNFEV